MILVPIYGGWAAADVDATNGAPNAFNFKKPDNIKKADILTPAFVCPVRPYGLCGCPVQSPSVFHAHMPL